MKKRVFLLVICLLASPDKSGVLVIGEVNGGIQFAIPIWMKDTSIETADPELFSLHLEPLYRTTPPPHELMSRYVYGWSPDSKSHAEARFYFDGYNRVNFTAQGEIVVINAESGDVLYTYSFQSDLQPLTAPFPGGFDIVWPAQP